MYRLIAKGAAYALVTGALFTSGLTLGYRLARDRYQGVIARTEQRFASERQTLREAATRIQIEAEQRVVRVERRKVAQLAEIDQQHQQELHNEKAKIRRYAAELRAARRRLYINIKSASGCGDRLPPTSPTASGNHGETRAELSTTAAAFLIGEASRADQIVRQLSACQAVVRADREVFVNKDASRY